jgi:hypothetical protein
MTVLRAHAISDAGLIVNPLLVEGQMQGGFAQGLGEAVMENLVLDDTGQLLTGSFMDYAMPRATRCPAADPRQDGVAQPDEQPRRQGRGRGRHDRRAHRDPERRP